MSFHLSAQKLGLVLSGGGGPGIAHIGIIKALEENSIPIDYITGTSIGAIVGGLYAMGYSPDEMIQFFKSDDFKLWSIGKTKPSDQYYFNTSDKTAGLFDIIFSIKKNITLNFKTSWIPTSLFKPHAMNLSFVTLCTQANAISGGNFDKLFVPYRCVASDVYNKQAYVFRSGQISDAIRASMTFPFVIKPLEINNHILFDGGIYNNFPVDIMLKEFETDYIIGSVVAYNAPKADKQDVLMQLQNMIIHKTDYSIPTANSLLINFDLKKYDTFDFSKVDELVQIGYDSVNAHIEEIKAKLTRTTSKKEINERRLKFKSNFSEIIFQKVEIEGVDSIEKKYIEQVVNFKNKNIDLKEFTNSYLKLISDERIKELIPYCIFDSITRKFNLKLKVESHDNLTFTAGLNLSSSLNNQIYIGVKYKNLNNIPITFTLDAQAGKTYNGLNFDSRIDVLGGKNIYLKISGNINKSDYYAKNTIFFENNLPIISQYESIGKFVLGLPLSMNSIINFGIDIGFLKDLYPHIYPHNNMLINSCLENDKSKYYMQKAYCKLEGNTLNYSMFPTNGKFYTTSIQLFKGQERFLSYNNLTNYTQKHLWFQINGKYEHYFKLFSNTILGSYSEFNYSNRNTSNNFIATLLQAGAFQPTITSRSVFNKEFHSNQFIAFGIKPIYNITDNLHFRNELYWFMPYQTILKGANQSTYYKYGFTSLFIFESDLIYRFKNATASIYANCSNKKLNVGVNLGILFQNKLFREL